VSEEAYRTVMLDPPWDLGGSRGGPGNHYRLMKTDAIIELVLATEVFRRVGPDAHCWLWVVGNLLPDGLRVMKALGFRYVTTSAGSSTAWASASTCAPSTSSACSACAAAR